MRYQSLTATTSVKCEHCGIRVHAEQLYFPTPAHRQQLQDGKAYHFSVQRTSLVGTTEVIVDAVYQTVCSQPCYDKALARTVPRVVAEIQHVSFDAKGLHGYVRAAVEV